MRFSTQAFRPFCEILRPSFFSFSTTFFRDYSGLPSSSPRCVCPVCFGFVQCHDHDVIKGFSLRCPILLRKTKFLHYSFTFSRYSITRSLMSLKWCSHPASFRHILVFNISWEFVSSDFKKKDKSNYLQQSSWRMFYLSPSQLSRCLHRVRLPHTELEMGDWSLSAPLLARLFRSLVGRWAPWVLFSLTRLCLGEAGCWGF